MSWVVGDKCVRDETLPRCGECTVTNETLSGILTVIEVVPGYEKFVGLEFLGVWNDPEFCWCSCMFRKVVDDAATSCEPEFVNLLQRIKRKANA